MIWRPLTTEQLIKIIMMKQHSTLMHESFETSTPSHWEISRANWAFSLDLGSLVVGECAFYVALLCNAGPEQGFSGNFDCGSQPCLEDWVHGGSTTDEEV